MSNNKKTYLVTGGTGSLGSELVKSLLNRNTKKVIVFSRDEFKQSELADEIQDKKIRFILGDVRDSDAVNRSFSGVDIVIHAAAMKRVEACEYNPFEAVKTNILGAQNIIDAAILNGVKKVLAISTDKSVNPINLYGATKLCSDKLFQAADAYSAGRAKFSVIRFGNFEGSRGSVIPLFEKQKENGEPLTVTDERMTRFFIPIDTAIERVFEALDLMDGGEVFSPKMPSIRIMDLAESKGVPISVIGMRPGEKLHEDMIIVEDATKTYDLGNFFVTTKIYRGKGKKVPFNFSYSSDNNWEWIKSI